ncbi:MAG: alpha/beta fold hydrolase [Myxococcota bacterium]
MRHILVVALVAACTRSPSAPTKQVAETAHCVAPNEVVANGNCLKLRAFESERLSGDPTLVVALHGDAPFSQPSYQYRFAELVAKRSTNTVAVGLLRPGYTDAESLRSDGERGEAVGDNYDAPRIETIAAAIRALRSRYAAKRIVLAGHSGGAAITAKLIALHAGLVDHAILVSCPCDIGQWRADMLEASGYCGFDGDLDARSPIDLVNQIPKTTRVDILVGQMDTVTKPALSRAYADALSELEKRFRFTVVDGDHEIFLAEEVLSVATTAVEEVRSLREAK